MQEAFGRCWEDFWKILERFEEDLWSIFGDYFQKLDFVKISVSPRREHENQGFELSKKHEKSMEN